MSRYAHGYTSEYQPVSGTKHRSALYSTDTATNTSSTFMSRFCTVEPGCRFSFTINTSSTTAAKNMKLKSAKYRCRMPAISASASATMTPPSSSTTMTPAMVRVERWLMRSCRTRFANGSTHSTGRHAKMPPKVTSLMVCPMYVVSNGAGCKYGNTPVALGGCRKYANSAGAKRPMFHPRFVMSFTVRL